jgi:hypothetical protein
MGTFIGCSDFSSSNFHYNFLFIHQWTISKCGIKANYISSKGLMVGFFNDAWVPAFKGLNAVGAHLSLTENISAYQLMDGSVNWYHCRLDSNFPAFR